MMTKTKQIKFSELVEMGAYDFYEWWKEEDHKDKISIKDYLLILTIQSKQIRQSVRLLNKKNYENKQRNRLKKV